MSKSSDVLSLVEELEDGRSRCLGSVATCWLPRVPRSCRLRAPPFLRPGPSGGLLCVPTGCRVLTEGRTRLRCLGCTHWSSVALHRSPNAEASLPGSRTGRWPWPVRMLVAFAGALLPREVSPPSTQSLPRIGDRCHATYWTLVPASATVTLVTNRREGRDMASREANEAVAAYRKMLLAERRVEEASRNVKRLGARLSEADFQDYARMTAEIDEALDIAVDGSLDYADSTREQYVRAAINRSGLDRENVVSA